MIDDGQEMQDEPMQGDHHVSESTPGSFPSSFIPRHVKGAPTSARSAVAPYPQPSRMVDQINRALERPQIKHTIPDLPNVPTGPRSQSSAGPIRRGGRGGISRGPPIPPAPLNFPAFMLANGLPPEFFQQMMAEAANFPNQMFPVMPGMNLADRISDKNMDGSSGILVAGGHKARCRHWPRCELGARCKFHHPSQICPYHSASSNSTNKHSDYPNCPNARGTCLNIHVGEDIEESELSIVIPQQLGAGKPPNGHSKPAPKANGQGPRRENQPPNPKPKSNKPQEQPPLCKFGAGCTKPDCPFAHPNPTAGQMGLVLRQEWCPDGRDCLNREVHLIIPPFHRYLLISVRLGSSKSCHRRCETKRNGELQVLPQLRKPRLSI